MLVQLYVICLLGILPALFWSLKNKHQILTVLSLLLIVYAIAKITTTWSN